ncbi:MarR family winged helix-turn-helix transcriptional regulator [Streptomyces sp. BK79]|uniref:MarR family winged helix-turn-helix transcriptional regulator n=1 Tax=Streptomyces sp. BK79 TaxID=3350097 RepID=UPI0037703160
MTRLGGPGDDRVGESGDEALAAAREIAEAVDGLAHLWAVAAQGALVRLSPQQLQALRVLQAGPGMNLTALAEATGLAMPAASRLCDRLEAAGLLGRTLHPRNRREVRLELTALGIQVLGDVADRRAEALAAVLAAMDTDTREALVRGMRGFARARWGADGRPRLSP